MWFKDIAVLLHLIDPSLIDLLTRLFELPSGRKNIPQNIFFYFPRYLNTINWSSARNILKLIILLIFNLNSTYLIYGL